jgi:hypothetical protein
MRGAWVSVVFTNRHVIFYDSANCRIVTLYGRYICFAKTLLHEKPFAQYGIQFSGSFFFLAEHHKYSRSMYHREPRHSENDYWWILIHFEP